MNNEERAVLGLYLGSPCKYSIGFGEFADAIFTGVGDNGVYISALYGQKLFTAVEVDGAIRFKLLLYSLADITDEDLIAVAKIVMRRHDRHFKPEQVDYKVETVKGGCPTVAIRTMSRERGEYIIRIEPDSICLMEHEESILYNGKCFHVPNQYEAIDYLRSKSYALPYKGIDLFTSGIAELKQRK